MLYFVDINCQNKNWSSILQRVISHENKAAHWIVNDSCSKRIFIIFAYKPKDLHNLNSNKQDLLEKRIKLDFSINMKPIVVADEMFPEGAGPFMELDEVNSNFVFDTFR